MPTIAPARILAYDILAKVEMGDRPVEPAVLLAPLVIAPNPVVGIQVEIVSR